MEAVGYDCEDWELSQEQIIEPQFSSIYVQNLASKGTQNIIKRFVDNLLQRFYAKK